MTEVDLPTRPALDRLNTMPAAEARRALARCCGSARWVESMLHARPFASSTSLLAHAETIWQKLDAADHLEAFSHHPDIGADPGELRARFGATADLSGAEQAGVDAAPEATLLALREANVAYRARFGYGFIVCATGKTAPEMLALLRARLERSPEAELAQAAAEQAKITRLRLQKIRAE